MFVERGWLGGSIGVDGGRGALTLARQVFSPLVSCRVVSLRFVLREIDSAAAKRLADANFLQPHAGFV